jgi:hypothetical protein
MNKLISTAWRGFVAGLILVIALGAGLEANAQTVVARQLTDTLKIDRYYLANTSTIGTAGTRSCAFRVKLHSNNAATGGYTLSHLTATTSIASLPWASKIQIKLSVASGTLTCTGVTLSGELASGRAGTTYTERFTNKTSAAAFYTTYAYQKVTGFTLSGCNSSASTAPTCGAGGCSPNANVRLGVSQYVAPSLAIDASNQILSFCRKAASGGHLQCALNSLLSTPTVDALANTIDVEATNLGTGIAGNMADADSIFVRYRVRRL